MGKRKARLRKKTSVVARTAGILKGEEGAVPIKDERIAVETAIAEETEERSGQ